MRQIVIENPVINSPFEEPKRHFRFTEDGITDEILEERRISQYFVPIPRAKKKSAKQLSFETEWTADRVEENKDINRIRERVSTWRKGGYVGVARTTARLLEYWQQPDREHKLFFCQIEALETAIYITEVAGRYGDAWIENLLRAEINKLAKKKWEEWEIPRKSPSPSGRGQGEGEITPLLKKYWQLRQERQRAIDASIARRADTEFLYDKPYQDNKRVRVSGPFTVESLSPHRVLTPDDPATPFKENALNTQDFTRMIIENLKASGVQNTIKNQRLKFDSLEPFAGTWIHAVGEYTEKIPSPTLGEGKGGGLGVRSRRAAISIGPELGTVSPEQVKEAAKEAVCGVGFDLLIVCGFAFDPHVSEEAKRYGNLTVLPTRMNPDLAMGDELLKKTGAGNLFMVFGEPDLEIRYVGEKSTDFADDADKKNKKEKSAKSASCPTGTMSADEKIVVHLKGLDVYDPTTGEIRSNTTDDIACWFIDTDYNGESFIVRHAYFTGADEPYEKLKRALRAEIDESAWSALYRTESIPFEKPKSGKIAVKVINHYGDEVLKVFEVR